jgi:phage baseplate assembly protein W
MANPYGQTPSRADYVTNVYKNQVIFSDIPMNFDMSPSTGDLAMITNIQAVGQSVQNLILTFFKERMYSKNIGCLVQIQTFELSTDTESETIKSAIKSCLQANEPRVQVFDVEVNVYNDLNSYNVVVSYYVINNPQLQSIPITIKLER